MGFGDGSGLVAGMPNPAGSLFTRRPRRSRAQDAAGVGCLDGFSNLCFLSWWKDGLRRCLCGGWGGRGPRCGAAELWIIG